MAGALTPPGLDVVIEATGSNMVSLGYGIAYPFGVISVVLFVQIIPSLLHVDIEKEREEYKAVNALPLKDAKMRLFNCYPRGFFGFSAVIVLGVLIEKITVPLPGGTSFYLERRMAYCLLDLSLGISGISEN